MVAVDDGRVGQSRDALPRAAGGSINGTRVFMGVLLLLIGVAAIIGITMAVTSGQPAIAVAIGLVATAFFARVGC